MAKSNIGLIGLGVMGSNLARNIANHKFHISVYNRTTKITDEFINEHGNEYIHGTQSLENFVEQLETPRKIIILVKAGPAVDAVIQQLTQLIEVNDIIIDCGNSNFNNTKKRFDELQSKGFHFVGCGVSGGEEGALNGPSLMPGGTKEAWKEIKNIFEPIAAKDFSGDPCVTYIGDNSAGHYVKMVHNGIEYGVMQIMAEAYDLLKHLYKLDPPKLSEIFKKYNDGKLKSFLFEISIEVLARKDDQSDGYLINHILDKAAQKGTGKWTAIDALKRGISLPTITEAVFARNISGNKKLREELSKKYPSEKSNEEMPLKEFTNALEDALFAAMLSAYAQGFALLQHAAKKENWDINPSEIARIWEGGCIIRADILNVLHKAFANSNKETHLFEIPEIITDLQNNIPNLQKIITSGVQNNIPVAGFATALAYIDSLSAKQLPANFIQGLRDNFGAHTYQRTDKEGSFHTEWNE